VTEVVAWTDLWQSTQEALSKESPLGAQRKTWLSGHYIQKDQPRLVIDSIRSVVQRSEAQHGNPN